MEVTIENLERAVSQFYHTDSVMQAQAHQWLTAAQSSPDAWAFVWQLLLPSRSAEVQFFAATTLHNKIMRNWSEVPADQYAQLKEKLLHSIIQYSTGPKIVLNRLCIALSAFVIQTTPYFWRDSLNDLMTMLTPVNFPNIPPERIIWILLEIFSVIPEEFESMVLSQKHKSLIKNELEAASNQVVRMVETVLGCGASPEVDVQAVKTSVSWLHFGVSLPASLTLAKKLVDTVINADDGDTCEPELEALYQMATHPDTHRFPSSIMSLLEILLHFSHLTETPDNPELVYNVYRVFVGLAESHTALLLKSLSQEAAESVRQLIKIILNCTAGPGHYPTQETHSQLTFGFWYIAQDEMVNLTQSEVEAARQVIVPAYREVSQVLLTKSRYPADSVSLSAQDAETFRCYRQDIADTMVYCYYVVKQYLVELLVSSLNRAESWQEVEAVYHVAFALAETVGADDDGTVVSLLASPPPQHLVNNRVLNTLNQSIGAYSEWLSGHGEALGMLVPRLVASLESAETATSATMALKDITRECTTSLKPLSEPLYTSCQEAVNRGHLKQNECSRLMYSMGKLLSIMPYESMVRNIQPLIDHHISAIQQIVSQPMSNQTKTALLGRLRMMSQLLGTLYTDDVIVEPPALIALSMLLPVLAPVAHASLNDYNIIQEVCTCLKNGVSSLLEKSEPLLEMIVNIVLVCYTAQPNPAALDLVRNVLLLFNGRKDHCYNLSVTLLHSVTATTLLLAPRASEVSDVIQSYHNLIANVVKKKPDLIISSVNSSQLFSFATGCLLLPEFGIVKAAGSFICNVISLGRENPAMLEAVQSNGQELIITCLRSIGGESPRNSLEVLCEIILCLNKKFCDDLSRWMSVALTHDNFPTPRASQQLKAAFSRTVIKERANKRKLQEAVREFSLVCRGLVTTDYTYQPPPELHQ